MRVLILIALLLLATTPAHAYLDPTTGSMLISAIVGVFASLALAIKTYWYRLKRFFGGNRKPPDSPPPGDSAG